MLALTVLCVGMRLKTTDPDMTSVDPGRFTSMDALLGAAPLYLSTVAGGHLDLHIILPNPSRT